jgi:phasin family protein
MTGAAKKFAEHHNEDVKHTIEKVTVAGEEVTRRMEEVYSKVTQETKEFQQRLLATTHANVDAAFECARELLGVTSPSEFMEVSTRHARQQFEAVRQQTKELAEIAQKTAIKSMALSTGQVEQQGEHGLPPAAAHAGRETGRSARKRKGVAGRKGR